MKVRNFRPGTRVLHKGFNTVYFVEDGNYEFTFIRSDDEGRGRGGPSKKVPTSELVVAPPKKAEDKRNRGRQENA